MERSEDLPRAVRELVLAVERFRVRAGKAHGLSPNAVTALVTLYLDGPQAPGALAQLLTITTASTTELIDRLEQGGHVLRRRHPIDRRRLLIELTPGGRALIAAQYTDFSDRLHAAATGLPAGEHDVLIGFLAGVRSGLTPQPDPAGPA